jgi:anti-sigma B factor antagonist
MIVQMRHVGDVRILDCSGKIKLGEGTISIRKVIGDALESGMNKILLNLEEVSYIDSSGIGGLISAYAAVLNGGGQLKLLHLTKRVRELLAITKLLTIFEVFDDEETALASFGKPRVGTGRPFVLDNARCESKIP